VPTPPDGTAPAEFATPAAASTRAAAAAPLVRKRTLLALAFGFAFVLWATAAGFGAGVFSAAITAALLPLPVYIALALWLDRFEPEPKAMLAMAFLWGGSVAILLAGFANASMDRVIGERMSAIATAPLFEETLKALILLRFYSRKKTEFDGPVDGLIYAAMVGLGFAFVENVDYYGRALAKGGSMGLAMTFTLRGVMGPFSHPLFTSLTGLGLGIARVTRRRWVRWTAPWLGFVLAVALHATWNAGASMGCVFLAVYAGVMVPAMLGLLVVAGVSLKAEGRVIRAFLGDERDRGILSDAEFKTLGSVRGRLRASLHALFRHGWRAERRRRAFHRAASELAFHRRRVANGEEPYSEQIETDFTNRLQACHEAEAARHA